jgi:putative DNA methylase
MNIVPHAWKDKPALIEVAFPAQKISIEAQCERKANSGQTLTAMGSYWKGRKPLVLVRACLLGTLLPSTGNTEEDLEIFEMLMAMDDRAFIHRMKRVNAEDVRTWGGKLQEELLDEAGKWAVSGARRRELLGRVLSSMPYDERLNKRSLRPEELPDEAFAGIWDRVNAHLGSNARSHSELIEQLGVLRFGHRPRVGDTFCGGGSIPFEAARLGCDIYASDLNPIACMLTWGALNVIGGDAARRTIITQRQEEIAAAVDEELTQLGVEHDAAGNRGKAYLYCMEVTCPQTGWSVPLAPSWVVSRSQRVVAKLTPDPQVKRYNIDIVHDAADSDFEAAARGTVQGGDMVHSIGGTEYRTSIRTIRGERKVNGKTVNDLRRWEKGDVVPRPDDTIRERLYCIQWVSAEDPKRTFFAAPTLDDHAREEQVEDLVRASLAKWQCDGLAPDMEIEDGKETEGPIRTRGWTHWHHLFTPRDILVLSLWKKRCSHPADYLYFALLLDLSSKFCQWLTASAGKAGGPRDLPNHVFYDQALKGFFNFAIRSGYFHRKTIAGKTLKARTISRVSLDVHTADASDVRRVNDIYVTDPPYADAVRYEEITEFFISWLRSNPPEPFNEWVWDSRRVLAIRGTGESFRSQMVEAYSALANHMPDNGMQIVMFTHQDAKVWGDMAGIFWAAGLRVTAAWYIATETTSELKKGGYVQGTVILVLRKRTETKKAYKDELVLEVREEVKKQLETMVGLNQQVRARGRSENLFEDADLQMAGYAAALRVLTGYTAIDGIDMTREALRPRTEGERTIVDELIEFAVAIANEELVPDGLDAKVWEKLVGVERFYLRMLDLEAAGLKKLDNYQNFAKAFRVGDWQPLMGSMKPNDAKLKSAREFKRAEFGETEFGSSLLRAVLYALYELEAELETDEVMSHLRDNVAGYYSRRADIVAVASYLAGKLERLRDDEAGSARVLRDLVKGERLGA